MKKLLRIIFLILLIHYAFGQCSFDSAKKVCTGEPTNEKKICLVNSDETDCTEGETCASKEAGDSGTLTAGDCNGLPVYNEKKEKLEYHTCVPTSDANGCEGKQLTCPTEAGLGEGKVCSGYSASENKACIIKITKVNVKKKIFVIQSQKIPQERKKIAQFTLLQIQKNINV